MESAMDFSQIVKMQLLYTVGRLPVWVFQQPRVGLGPFASDGELVSKMNPSTANLNFMTSCHGFSPQILSEVNPYFSARVTRLPTLLLTHVHGFESLCQRCRGSVPVVIF
jgi:hypothetical protein